MLYLVKLTYQFQYHTWQRYIEDYEDEENYIEEMYPVVDYQTVERYFIVPPALLDDVSEELHRRFRGTVEVLPVELYTGGSLTEFLINTLKIDQDQIEENRVEDVEDVEDDEPLPPDEELPF